MSSTPSLADSDLSDGSGASTGSDGTGRESWNSAASAAVSSADTSGPLPRGHRNHITPWEKEEMRVDEEEEEEEFDAAGAGGIGMGFTFGFGGMYSMRRQSTTSVEGTEGVVEESGKGAEESGGLYGTGGMAKLWDVAAMLNAHAHAV
ncbi:hypothetical protein HK102_011153 [Quaeritorhiza haematococci]|nr:hypothetical protein HK102_011153 [Quaeritorhiza haematococci]